MFGFTVYFLKSITEEKGKFSTELVAQMFQCKICFEDRNVEEFRQLLPCLHMFCTRCLILCEKFAKTTKAVEVCPAISCFSKIKTQQNKRFSWKRCESDRCMRKQSIKDHINIDNNEHLEISEVSREFPLPTFLSVRCYPETLRLLNELDIILQKTQLEKTPCQHEICQPCLETARRSNPPICPAYNCMEYVNEAEETVKCDGPCQQTITNDKFVATKCCSATICPTCYEQIFKKAFNPDEEAKCTGECIRKEVMTKEDDQLAKCKANEDCTRPSLNGFPSKAECEHDVCIQCLEQMIDDCQLTGAMPKCPNEVCNALYCVESVISLKTLLPQKSDYFNSLALENWGYDVIKDERASAIKFIDDYRAEERYMDIKVKLSDEEAVKKIPFDKQGSVADFIRELRFEFKIQPLDKVYGYFIRKGDLDESDANKITDEELNIDQEAMRTSVEEYGITDDCVIVVDLIGFVQSKSASTVKRNP